MGDCHAIVRVLGAVLVLWALDVTAAGASPILLGAGSTPTRPVGDGARVVFAATPQLVVGRDPQAHRTWRFRFDGACTVSDGAPGAVLVNCALPGDAAHGGRTPYQQPYVLLAGSGRRVALATRDGQDATPGVYREHFDQLGSRWAHAEIAIEGCYHCEGEAFLNWHSMKRRERGTFPTPPPPVDLDDPGLRRLAEGTLAARGDTRLASLPGHRLGLVTGDRPARVLSRCAPGDCLAAVLYGSHAAWIQRIHRGTSGRWAARQASVRGGGATTWWLPRQRCGAGDAPATAIAHGGLYVSGCRRNATGLRPLYHARPDGARAH